VFHQLFRPNPLPEKFQGVSKVSTAMKYQHCQRKQRQQSKFPKTVSKQRLFKTATTVTGQFLHEVHSKTITPDSTEKCPWQSFRRSRPPLP
jgi:predicted RecB family endonuclease